MGDHPATKLAMHTQPLVEKLLKQTIKLSRSRKEKLESLARAIATSLQNDGKADVIVICTHNSRRSHIGQLSLKLAAIYFGFDHIFTFSGGTEATALNPRVVTALKSHRLKVDQLSEGPNPKYYIPLTEEGGNYV